MIFYIIYYIGEFAFSRIKNKIICYYVGNSIKRLTYTPEWEYNNRSNLNMLIDWVFLL